jgi:hypothetical protein
MLTERRGRDVGSAKSGFRPTLVGKIMPTDLLVHSPFRRVAHSPDLPKLTRMGSRQTATEDGTV